MSDPYQSEEGNLYKIVFIDDGSEKQDQFIAAVDMTQALAMFRSTYQRDPITITHNVENVLILCNG